MPKQEVQTVLTIQDIIDRGVEHEIQKDGEKPPHHLQKDRMDQNRWICHQQKCTAMQSALHSGLSRSRQQEHPSFPTFPSTRNHVFPQFLSSSLTAMDPRQDSRSASSLPSYK